MSGCSGGWEGQEKLRERGAGELIFGGKTRVHARLFQVFFF
jgi:hypothetical protein